MKRHDNLFGDTIRRRRVERQMTQKDVAQRLKVAQNFVTYLENGQRKPTDEMIKKLAKILSLPNDQLYFEAHPELEAMLGDDKPMQVQLAPALAELKSDQVLRNQHDITNEEIEQLASIRFRGEIKRKEDYVFLLMSIRRAIE